LAFLVEVLIPRFTYDHKYLDLSIDMTNGVDRDDTQRLREFATLFGFGPRRWHLSRAARQIERYVNCRGDRVGAAKEIERKAGGQARKHYELLTAASDRLDFVFNGGK